MTRRRKFYPTSEERIQLDGGKHNKFSPNVIADNESPDILNVIYGDGTAGTREGYSKANSNSVGSFAGDGLYTRRDNDTSETMIAWWDGTAHTWDGSTFTAIGSAINVYTAGLRVCATQAENHIFFGNGAGTPYKYNGSAFTRHGVEAATGALSIVCASTGNNLTGNYSYRVTYVNSQLVEGDVGTAVSITYSTENGNLTGIPTAPQSFGVNARRIYRTEASGLTYLLLTTLNDNTTTTYEDGVADASLGAAAPTDNGVPPNYTCNLQHQNRIFCDDPSNPNYVFYSELNNPYVFGASNFVRIGDNASDLVMGLAVYQDQVIVFCERSIWMIYMPDTDPTNWKTIKLDSQFGSKSPYVSIPYRGKLLFAATQNDKFMGFAAISGTSTNPQVSLLTTTAIGSDLQSAPIEPDMFLVPETTISNISGIVFQDKAYITLTYGSGATMNNRIYYVDFSFSNATRQQDLTWVPWDGMNAEQLTIYSGDLYFISSNTNGRVYQLLDGTYNDDGSAINSYLYTREFGGHKTDVSLHKDFRSANILVDKAGDYFMDLTYKTDSDSGDGNTVQVDLDPGGSLWGVMVWGVDNWGGGEDREDIRVYLGTASGKRIQFKFSNQNTADQRFKVHGLNFVYNLKGYR